MAFNLADLNRVGPLFDDLPFHYVYTTSDSIAVATAQSYFPDTLNLRRGDSLRIVASDAEVIAVVMSQTAFVGSSVVAAISVQVRETL
jgi:hypothetical protein